MGQFQFTHPVWGATGFFVSTPHAGDVSIHAPRVGCDRDHRTGRLQNQVSIHAPRVGCDGDPIRAEARERPFQFTHPVWGATPEEVLATDLFKQFQFTHPVWGATLDM